MIDASLREKLKTLKKRLCESILGQEEVIREIVPISIIGELGINSEGKPKANLLLLGPPGVGKTDICNVFTDYLLGSEKLIRFDMSEYQTVESIYRLLGHNGEEGLFGLNYNRVDGPGTLLFDEIEKAHERVLDLFLQLLSAARLTLGSGRGVESGGILRCCDFEYWLAVVNRFEDQCSRNAYAPRCAGSAESDAPRDLRPL